MPIYPDKCGLSNISRLHEECHPGGTFWQNVYDTVQSSQVEEQNMSEILPLLQPISFATLRDTRMKSSLQNGNGGLGPPRKQLKLHSGTSENAPL